jgi:uncharacterized protein (TIGR04141 family)
MQHLTIFLLKKRVKNFADAVKAGGDAGNPISLTNQPFDGSLYLPAPAENPPGWLPFVESGFPGRNVAGNRMPSALVLLKAEKRVFALTFGHARYFLKPEAYERDFGLRVVVNRVSKDKIRAISLRMFKETPVKRHEEAAKGTVLRTFGVDIQQDLLRAVTGVPEDPSFAARVSGADSLAIDVEMDFGDLADKCKDLLTAYSATEYAKRGFDWIDNLKAVRTPATVEQLDKALVSALKAKDQNIQMLCPDNFNRDSICGFLYQEEEADAAQHTELEMDEWQNAIVGELANLTADKLSERRIKAFDGHGAKAGEIPDRDCFVFETDVKGIKYVLSNGEWFEVATAFDAKISKYVNAISRKPVLLPDFQLAWKGVKGAKGLKGEDKYVAEAAKAADLMSMHKATCTIGGTAIEPCDLLHRTGALVHVKVWSASATFSHLLAQGAISAESLLRYSKFRDHVANKATKHAAEIKKLFPTQAFVTSKLDVVLALVRNNPKPLPFFSRLNLMREGQRIERLGYRVNYHRIEIK